MGRSFKHPHDRQDREIEEKKQRQTLAQGAKSRPKSAAIKIETGTVIAIKIQALSQGRLYSYVCPK